jgi:hypothetical protein
MTSLGPDWHDKTVPMLWRTWFAASTQPILLRMSPQTLKVPHNTFLVSTLRFAQRSSCQGSWFLVRSRLGMDPGVSAGMLLQPLVESKEMAQHCITNTYWVVANTRTAQHGVLARENERAHLSVSSPQFVSRTVPNLKDDCNAPNARTVMFVTLHKQESTSVSCIASKVSIIVPFAWRQLVWSSVTYT